MGLVHYLGMDCDLCGTPLKVSEIADGWDTGKIVPGLTSTAPAMIKGSLIDIHDVADGAGWEQDPDHARAGRVDSRWTCRMCVGRIRTMHAWIKTNRMISDDHRE